MANTLRYLALLLLAVVCLNAYAFEYRIVMNETDSTLNGMEIRLRNLSEYTVPYSSVIENGVIDIKGESERTFPAVLHITGYDGEKRKQYKFYMIVEPGEIVIDRHSTFPLSGGELNKGLNAFHDRLGDLKADSGFTPKEIRNKEIRKLIEQNVGNGLGEYGLWFYAYESSPKEWTEVINLFDEKTRNMTLFDDVSGVKQRQASVWDGQPFRDVEGQTLDGETALLSDYVGKGYFVLVDVWASWCGGCISMAQHILMPLYEEYKNNPEIQFLSIATDDVSKLDFAHEIPWPQIMKSKKLVGTYVIKSFPELILFGPDGTILKRYVDHTDMGTVKRFLDEELERYNNSKFQMLKD